ncbi:hypothetical protein ES703_102281 [subsurface metagenome]
MAQHFLNAPQVRSSLQEMGGERMPQDVRGNPLLKVHSLSILLEHLPESLTGEGIAEAIDE